MAYTGPFPTGVGGLLRGSNHSFTNTIGSLLIGGLLMMAMWGFLCSQTFTFFKQITRNGPVVKSLIIFLWAIETIHSGLVIHLLYIYLVSNYLNPNVAGMSTWCLSAIAAIASISNVIVRSMFTWRYYRLSHKMSYAVFITVLSAIDLSSRLLLVAKGFFTTFLENSGDQGLFYFAFSSNALCNFCMFLGLSTVFRPLSMPNKWDVLLNALIVYSLDTGLLVVINSFVVVLAYAEINNRMGPLASYLILSKLFCISYLAMINGRDLITCKGRDTLSVNLSNIPTTQTHTEFGWHEKSRSEAMPIAIHTTVETRVATDCSASSSNALTFVGFQGK